MARADSVKTATNYTLSAWRMLKEEDVAKFLEQQVITTDRLTVVRCVYRPGYEVPAHYHPQEQITIVEEGVLSMVVDGKVIEVNAGQVISIPTRVRHATMVTGKQVVRALNLFVRPDAGPIGEGDFHGPRMYR